MKKLLLATLVGFVVCGILAAPVSAGDNPIAVISEQVGKILKVLGDPDLQGADAKTEKKRQVTALADNVFDYQELSRRALGRNWRKLNEKQQKEFVTLFSSLLSKVYMDRILEYSNEKVSFDKETMLSDDKAEVQSNIITSSKTIPMDYRMILHNAQWQVYDVIIEGVSLVKNYRSQFKEILARNPPEKLLKLLREKTAEV